MKSTLYLMLKAFFFVQIFTFLSWLFGSVEKRIDEKGKVTFKINDVTKWTTNNYNTHIAQYLEKGTIHWYLVS